MKVNFLYIHKLSIVLLQVWQVVAPGFRFPLLTAEASFPNYCIRIMYSILYHQVTIKLLTV